MKTARSGFLVTTASVTASPITSGFTSMPEADVPSEQELDDAAFELGCKLDIMLIRLNEFVIPDSSLRREYLQFRWGRRVPNTKELQQQSKAVSDLAAYRRLGRLPVEVLSAYGVEHSLR